MDEPLLYFEKFLYEAPGDDPPDTNDDTPPDVDMDAPPDLPNDTDDGPPDLNDNIGEEGTDDSPPDLTDEGDFNDVSYDDEPQSDEVNEEDLGLDDKVSSVMNMNLYQQFLSLIRSIASQLANIKDNSDVFYTINNESLDIVKSLKLLDENIRIYLKNNFQNSNYSKNLLFFNKCINLLNLVDDSFNQKISKGIKEMK